MNAARPVVVRPSRLKEAAWLAIFVLMMVGFGVLGDRTSCRIGLVSATVVSLLSLPVFFDTTPRLIIADDGLSWRQRKSDALSFLAWSEIVTADMAGGGEDDPRCLRLKLERPSALEPVASGLKSGRKVDIPIERLNLSERQLMVAIHRRASHLFTRVSYRAA